MNIFKLEDYLSLYEFSAPYLLCCSDAESFSMHEILAMASPEARSLWEGLNLGYTEVPGLPRLREQIVTSLYPSLDPSHILCFAGAEEGIFCALHVLCEPQDNVIVLTPCYQSLKEIPALKGATVTLLPLQEENQWRIDLEAIASAVRPNTKGVIINFPHNPTGQVITREEMEALCRLCDSMGLWLFSDEVYRLLGNPETPWASPAAEIYPKALSLGVMSKAFGMAGLRIGWIACQDKALLKKIAQVRHYTSICNSAPAEILSLIALQNKEQILHRNNQIVASNLQLLDQFMENHKDSFQWVRPQGGCIGFVHYKSSESAELFSQKLIERQGVLLMPASIYDHQSNHFRIGFGRRNMPESLNKLEDFLKKEKTFSLLF